MNSPKFPWWKRQRYTKKKNDIHPVWYPYSIHSQLWQSVKVRLIPRLMYWEKNDTKVNTLNWLIVNYYACNISIYSISIYLSFMPSDKKGQLLQKYIKIENMDNTFYNDKHANCLFCNSTQHYHVFSLQIVMNCQHIVILCTLLMTKLIMKVQYIFSVRRPNA